jgi:hypothetical protein
MNGRRALYQAARADFLERVRRYSFLVTLGVAAYLAYAAFTGRLSLRVHESRGIYNSAWVGTLMALVSTVFVSLAGFYVVKNTIERDRQTRVGQILAATPLTKFMYVAAKTASNFAVLAVMSAMLALAGLAMQLWSGEDRHIELWKMAAPWLLLALPALAVIAAVAVLFETIPFLRDGLGDIVYFFAWTAGIALSLATGLRRFDLCGIAIIARSLVGGESLRDSGMSFSLDFGQLHFANQNFRWEGIAWNGPIVLSRVAWAGAALAIVALAAQLFDRFDPARGKPLHDAPEREMAGAAELSGLQAPAPAAVLTPLPATALSHVRFWPVFAAELRLLLKGQKWWWYAVAAGLLIASAAVPSAGARGKVLAFAWIWPVLLWSSMGVREIREQTYQILFAAPHPIARQLPAVWFAGFALAVLTGGGFALRLLAEGNFHGLAAWLIGALFIPTLALALGAWSGSSKPFVVLYTMLWYAGPVNATPQLDFMGSSPATASTHSPEAYFLMTFALAIAMVAGRRRQLQT